MGQQMEHHRNHRANENAQMGQQMGRNVHNRDVVDLTGDTNVFVHALRIPKRKRDEQCSATGNIRDHMLSKW
jgi:hypothetical protein